MIYTYIYFFILLNLLVLNSQNLYGHNLEFFPQFHLTCFVVLIFRHKNRFARRQGDSADSCGCGPSPDQTRARSKTCKQNSRNQISRMFSSHAARA